MRTELLLYETRDQSRNDAAESETTHTIDIQHDEFVDDTTFVDSDGWTTQMKTLLETEIEHHEDSHSTCSDCHELEIWQDTHNIKSPEVEDAYDNDHPSTNIDAWNVENAGVQNSAVLSSAQDGEDSVFQGGFAGICEDGERWQYDNIDNTWECSGDFSWEQPSYLPETDNSFMALIIPHTNFLSGSELGDWSHTFDNYHIALERAGMATEFGEPESLNVECWPGTLGDEDAKEEAFEDGDYIEGTVSVPDEPEQPIGVYGELSHDGEYACSWNYSTDGEEEYQTVEDIGTTIEMHRDQSDEFAENVVEEHFDEVNGLETSYSSLSSFESETSSFNLDKAD